MNSISEIAKAWPKPGKKMISAEQKLNLLLKHPVVKEFSSRYPKVTRTEYRRFWGHLDQLVKETENCNSCPGLARCPNMIQGHTPELVKYADYLDLVLSPCVELSAIQEAEKRKTLIRSHYIPRDILASSFNDIEYDNDRVDAIQAAVEFCSRFSSEDTRPTKGLYLYGPLGVGKSRIAGAILNELVKHSVDSFMFYVPEFMREVTESIHDHSLQRKLEELKKASVLIFDDIGAEFLTLWKRDEILGAILQYRSAEQLPTIFTSNMDLDELENHFTHTNKGSDGMKARRIMERIRHYTSAYYIDGKNWREKVEK